MNSRKYFQGAEFEGVIIEFKTPNEFNCSFIDENEYIKLSEFNPSDNSCAPNKSEIVRYKKFAIRVGDENVLCEVLRDLKDDEVNCQVLLCNTSANLKVNYQSLRIINEDIYNDNLLPLKIYDFAPEFLKLWNDDLLSKMKEKVLFNRFIIQFKSNMPDPVDGRYLVSLLDIASKKAITDQFIDNKLAIRYSNYYQSWLDHERNKIFDTKESDNRKYVIGAPMFKNGSLKSIKTNAGQKYKLNVEAVPFTPIASNIKIEATTDGNVDNSSSFSFENIPGFANDTIVSNYVSGDNQTPSKLSLVPRIEKPIKFKTGNVNFPINDSKRVKKGLEVLSPSSEKKTINTTRPMLTFTDSFVLETDLQMAEQLRACNITPPFSINLNSSLMSMSQHAQSSALVPQSVPSQSPNTPMSLQCIPPLVTAHRTSIATPKNVNSNISTGQLTTCSPGTPNQFQLGFPVQYIPLPPYSRLQDMYINPIATNLPGSTQSGCYSFLSRTQ